MTVSYAEVLARNVRSARARKGLDQEPLAARMRALGFDAWRRQTVASVEKNTRRLTAEEVLGLALALETSFIRLLEPVRDDGPITLPSGDSMLFLTVHGLIWGGSQHTVQWDGEIPRFPVDEQTTGWTFDEPIPPPPIRRESGISGIHPSAPERENSPHYPRSDEEI